MLSTSLSVERMFSKLIGLQKHNLIKTVFLCSSCHVMSCHFDYNVVCRMYYILVYKKYFNV